MRFVFVVLAVCVAAAPAARAQGPAREKPGKSRIKQALRGKRPLKRPNMRLQGLPPGGLPNRRAANLPRPNAFEAATPTRRAAAARRPAAAWRPASSYRIARALLPPLPTPNPLRGPSDFVRRWVPPAAPPADSKGAPFRASAIERPPHQHAAILGNPEFVAGVLADQANEVQPKRYYWHERAGVQYAHYYSGDTHWYGFYDGKNYYWTQHYDGRWWWHDPTAQRYVYYDRGYWWWQDPDAPETVYVHIHNGYIPYAAAAAMAASTKAALPPVSGDVSITAAPVAPRYRSDVDEPGYASKMDSNRFALVVGVERYAALPSADFAERDALAVRAHLERLGYPARNLVVLTSSQAARASVAKYVEGWLPDHVTADSRVFVYFSGHGAPDPKTGTAYLMPWDGDAKYLATTGYPLKDLYDKLNALPAKELVVVLDACFSGAGGRSVLPAGARPLVTKADVGRGASGRAIVFSASGPDEITGTIGDQGHGLFTYYFLKGLNGAAGAAAGGVTVQDLFDYLAPNVEDAARRDNRDQTPQLLVPPDGRRKMLLREP